jgi:hypothetical protein
MATKKKNSKKNAAETVKSAPVETESAVIAPPEIVVDPVVEAVIDTVEAMENPVEVAEVAPTVSIAEIVSNLVETPLTYRVGLGGLKFPLEEFSKRDVEKLNQRTYVESSVLINFLVDIGQVKLIRKQKVEGQRGKPTDIFDLVS